jgi:hypothetical protein
VFFFHRVFTTARQRLDDLITQAGRDFADGLPVWNYDTDSWWRMNQDNKPEPAPWADHVEPPEADEDKA